MNDKASIDDVSSVAANPDTPCVIRDSDHSIVTSDGLISENFEYYFLDKNTVAVDVTVTNNSEREVNVHCTPRISAKTDLTPEDFSVAWNEQLILTPIGPGESTVLTDNYPFLEDGWSSADINIRLYCTFENDRYDPSEMDFDFTVNYDDVEFRD